MIKIEKELLSKQNIQIQYEIVLLTYYIMYSTVQNVQRSAAVTLQNILELIFGFKSEKCNEQYFFLNINFLAIGLLITNY